MSFQEGTEDKSKVGELVQKMLDTSNHDKDTEIFVYFSEGTWYVTRDHK